MPYKPLTDPNLAGDLIGFTAGLMITVLLLALTIRAKRLPGTPRANILVAVCGLLWNGGGLALTLMLANGFQKGAPATTIPLAIQYAGASLWPLPLLAIWRPYAVLPWQRTGSRVLQVAGTLSATALCASILSLVFFGNALLPLPLLKELTVVNASILVLGAVLMLKSSNTSGAMWLSTLTILFGVFGSTLTTILHATVALPRPLDTFVSVMSKQSTLLVVLGAFFLFARFRFADVFIHKGIRILLASAASALVCIAMYADWIGNLAARTAFPRAAEVFLGSMVLTVLLLKFASIDRWIEQHVDRWVVRAPDYRNATRELAEALQNAQSNEEVIAIACEKSRTTLDLESIQFIPLDRMPTAVLPAEIHDGEVVESAQADLLIPVRYAGAVNAVLAVSPGGADCRGLVSHEVSHLRTVAAQIGARIDALHQERDLVERRNRESLLMQQLTEAELRALRAQINPHFLFNALNTIADMIVTNPTGAEAMTLRLARVFRHVLAHSSRPWTSIREEVEFLRAYLQIEEARFGDRLHVDIDVPSEVGLHQIPSLILQPVVENALKHGLAPKPGPGHLRVSAELQGDDVCLKIEDDGMGPDSTGSKQSLGVGLPNVSQRLAMLYENRASVRLEPRESGGTSVTILIPRVLATEVA